MKAKFVSENIKFQRGGNPLRTMDLGGFSFETLRPGAILQAKRWFGVSKSTGNIGGYHSSAISISKGDWFLVTDVRDQEGGKKNISWRRYHNTKEEMVYQNREELRKEGKLHFLFGPISGFFDDLTKRRFDYRLEVVEPGFPVNESTYFHRTGDPKRGMGIGERTWENLKPGDILIPKQNFKIDRHGTPMAPSKKGGMFFYEESPLVVVKVRWSSALSSTRPEATVVNGLKIEHYTCWDMDDALETRKKIENGTFDVPNLRRPIVASIPALERRLEIYEG